MSEHSEYFLNSKSSVVQLELIEISHPDFTQVYRVVRNAAQGITVTLEDLSQALFSYYPLKITPSATREHLDQSYRFDLGDLGEVIPLEVDAVSVADGFAVKPTVKYRTYRSDDLTKPLYGPVVLEVSNFAFNKIGVSFDAKAPSLNLTKTGEIYDLARFPMLRGFL